MIASTDTVTAAANSVGGGAPGGVAAVTTGATTSGTPDVTVTSGADGAATDAGLESTGIAGAGGSDVGDEAPPSDGSTGSASDAAAASGGASGQPQGTTGELVSPRPAIGTLLLSEYVESTTDKAVELVNVGDEVAHLDSCQLEIYFNGKKVLGNRIALTSELDVGGALVICKTNGTAELLAHCDQTSGSLTFNGNDTLVLSCDGEVYDSMGELGIDPGTEWTSVMAGDTGDPEGMKAEYGTTDHVLRRCCGIGPRTEPEAPFDLGSEWSTVLDLSANTVVADYSGLGQPECAAAL